MKTTISLMIVLLVVSCLFETGHAGSWARRRRETAHHTEAKAYLETIEKIVGTSNNQTTADSETPVESQPGLSDGAAAGEAMSDMNLETNCYN